MWVRGELQRVVFGGLLVLAGMLWCNGASATTIYTFTFEQNGYTNFGDATDQGKLTGGFTGAADSGGVILQGALTDFHLEFKGFTGALALINGSYATPMLTYFSFHVGDNTSLAFVAKLFNPDYLTPQFVCVGAGVGLRCEGGTGLGYLAASIQGLADTDNAPKMTLVSQATTPIPGPALLFGTALAGLALLGRVRQRQGML